MPGHVHRLLVVDDNEVNRDMLSRRLRRKGYEVDNAADGPAALDMIRNGAYDLIVLDIMMPGMSGIEVLKHLRDKFSRAELPILMATARTESEDMVDALSLGANDYVTKPIDFPVVLARIEAHLQTRQQAPSLRAPAASIGPDGRAPPGAILDGRYEVETTLGEGGFAVVFRAKQLSTGQPVAVKVLHSLRAGQHIDKHRFEREMKLIGELRHPNIVRLIDFGELQARIEEPKEWVERSDEVDLADLEAEDEEPETRTVVRSLPYIVMEFLDGEPLSDWLAKEAPLDPKDAVELLVPVLSAVGNAHNAGIVHRDLKPPNIIVTRGLGDRPHPWVLDFGIAKPTADDESSALNPLELLGTPEYMAPEVAQNGTHAADERSDQYSLGVILYESLTGRRPFEADNVIELVHKVTQGQIEPLRTSRPDISLPLETTIMRALDRDPRRRFSSVEAFGKALLRSAPDGVRAQWTSSFRVQTDPPPPPADVLTPDALAPPSSLTTKAKQAAEADTATSTPPPANIEKVAWATVAIGLALAGAAALIWLMR